MMMNKLVDGVVVTMSDVEVAEFMADQPSAAGRLAQARAAAIDELVVDSERKRLKALRDAMTVEFAGANSEQAVANKLALLKEARSPPDGR